LIIDRSFQGGGGAYAVTGNAPNPNNRMHQVDFFSGGGSAGERGRQPRPYDAEYNQRNNDVKASTLASYTPAGNMGLFSGDINMTAKPKDKLSENESRNGPYYASSNSICRKQWGTKVKQLEIYSNIQLDRADPDLLTQLKGEIPICYFTFEWIIKLEGSRNVNRIIQNKYHYFILSFCIYMSTLNIMEENEDQTSFLFKFKTELLKIT
jgi:hypothetical protein